MPTAEALISPLERQSPPLSLDFSIPPVPRRFLEILQQGDFSALEEVLAADIWLRGLLPRTVHESFTAREATAAFDSWVGSPFGSVMVAAGHHTMQGREQLRYRFLVRPRWAPEHWHLIEQVGYCRVKEGRIRRIDLSCTGYFPHES